MATKPIRLVLLFILAFFSSVTPQNMAIAVIDLQGKGISQVEASALTDRLRSEIMNVSSATMVERDEMDQVLSEQDFQQTGCVSSECLVEVGQLVGVTQIIGGSISKVGNTFSVNARIIDVETGEIVNSVNYDLTGVIDELLISGMRNVSQLLFAGSGGDYLELGRDYEYYESGQLRAEGRSITGVKLGRWIYYYENGRIQKVGNYKDGNKSGKWTYYDINGAIKSVEDFYIVPKIANWAHYDENGEIIAIVEIIPAQSFLGRLFRQAEVIEYYQSGEIKAKSEKKHGLVHGKRTVYSVSGAVLHEYVFNNGTGYYFDYYENGQVKESGNCRYYDGVTMTRIYRWMKCYPNGKPLSRIEYDSYGNVVAEEHY